MKLTEFSKILEIEPVEDLYEELVKVAKSYLHDIWEIKNLYQIIERDSIKGYRISYVNPETGKIVREGKWRKLERKVA